MPGSKGYFFFGGGVQGLFPVIGADPRMVSRSLKNIVKFLEIQVMGFEDMTQKELYYKQQ